jgi:hypothetical protein
LEWNSICFGQFLCPSSGVFHCTHSNGICHTGLLTACEQDKCSCSQAVSKLVWHIPSLCVQWKTPDDGQRNCPKHVEFQSKNKFEKLVHPVGFIMRNLSRCTVTWVSNSRSSMYEVSSSLLYFLPLGPRLLIQRPILKYSHPMYLHRNEEKVLNLYSTTGEIISRESSLCTPQRQRGRAEVQIRLFLTAALDGGKGPTSGPSRFTPRERAYGTNGQETGWAPEPVWMF